MYLLNGSESGKEAKYILVTILMVMLLSFKIQLNYIGITQYNKGSALCDYFYAAAIWLIVSIVPLNT